MPLNLADRFFERAERQPDTSLIAGTPVKLGRNAIFARPGIGAALPPQLDGINPAFIRFTSGTTGTAKGVVLSHESIHARIHAANERLQLGPRDRVLWLLSLDYHFAVSICAYLTFGAGIVLPRNAFGESLLAAANEQRATLIYGAPAHYALMTQDDCAPGQGHGEVLLRGSGMLDAYYAPYRPRELILQDGDGWFHTGDLGRLDEDGFLYIVGRGKDA